MTLKAELVETEGGRLGRTVQFIKELSEAGQRGDFTLSFKIGLNVDTHEPAIGIAVNDGAFTPFTIAEARHLANMCEETLHEDKYEEIGDHINRIIADIRHHADRAEQLHTTSLAKLSELLTKH